MAFDPRAHRLAEQRWFADFTLGERFPLPSRTMTEAIFLAFQAASGDNHPVHYDTEYCRARGMPHMLAHGLQTLIQTAPGAGLFPYLIENSLVGFLDQSSRFHKPVYAGDTLYPALEVDESAAYDRGEVTSAQAVRAGDAARRSAVLPLFPRYLPYRPDRAPAPARGEERQDSGLNHSKVRRMRTVDESTNYSRIRDRSL